MMQVITIQCVISPAFETELMASHRSEYTAHDAQKWPSNRTDPVELLWTVHLTQ
jgi:hypothetical protein